jgi:hypothetical protein
MRYLPKLLITTQISTTPSSATPSPNPSQHDLIKGRASAVPKKPLNKKGGF